MGKTHFLDSSEVHSKWTARIAPRLSIDSGDTVIFQTRDGFDGQISPPVTTTQINDNLEEVIDFSRVAPLTGPVYIRGAKPGDILLAEIVDIKITGTGSVLTFPSWFEADFIKKSDRVNFRDGYLKHFDMDEAREKGYIEFYPGIQLAVEPMVGMMGTAPARGEFVTSPPRDFGGNMDTKITAVGSKVYLPIFVEGALFSTGDVHAVQGDGEICTTAIETPAEIEIAFSLVDKQIERPFIESANFISTIGHGRTLIEAGRMAINDMLDYLNREYNLPYHEGYMLMSLNGDLRISQVVNWPHIGVRLEIPTNIFKEEF